MVEETRFEVKIYSVAKLRTAILPMVSLCVVHLTHTAFVTIRNNVSGKILPVILDEWTRISTHCFQIIDLIIIRLV